jgi:hypothetical protein
MTVPNLETFSLPRYGISRRGSTIGCGPKGTRARCAHRLPVIRHLLLLSMPYGPALGVTWIG